MQKSILPRPRTKNGMESLYNVIKLDDDGPGEQDDGAQPVQDAPLAGESVTYWAIVDPAIENSNPIPLPRWFQLPIDNVCLTWKRENEMWQKRIKKRHEDGKDDLAPKAKQAYEEWLKTQERVLVLDKKRRQWSRIQAPDLRRPCDVHA